MPWEALIHDSAVAGGGGGGMYAESDAVDAEPAAEASVPSPVPLSRTGGDR